MPYRKRLTI